MISRLNIPTNINIATNITMTNEKLAKHTYIPTNIPKNITMTNENLAKGEKFENFLDQFEHAVDVYENFNGSFDKFIEFRW